MTAVESAATWVAARYWRSVDAKALTWVAVSTATCDVLSDATCVVERPAMAVVLRPASCLRLSEEIVKDILDNPDKYLTKERFDITKEYYENKFEKENILLHNNGYKFYEQEHFSLERILPSLTYEEIRKVYDKHFDFSKFYQSLDKNEFINK